MKHIDTNGLTYTNNIRKINLSMRRSKNDLIVRLEVSQKRNKWCRLHTVSQIKNSFIGLSYEQIDGIDGLTWVWWRWWMYYFIECYFYDLWMLFSIHLFRWFRAYQKIIELYKWLNLKSLFFGKSIRTSFGGCIIFENYHRRFEY
jgi:hypothetical protein